MFRFEEEEPPSDTEFSQYHGSAETERATCAPTRFPLAHFFRFFLWASKERSPPEATGHGNELQRQRANPQSPGGLPAAAGIPLIRHGASVSRVVPPSPRRRQSLRRDESKTRDVSLLRERPSFAARRKKAKTRPGNHSIKVPRGPSSRPRGLRPHWIPHFWTRDGGLRRTRDEGRRTKYGERNTKNAGRGDSLRLPRDAMLKAKTSCAGGRKRV